MGRALAVLTLISGLLYLLLVIALRIFLIVCTAITIVIFVRLSYEAGRMYFKPLVGRPT